MIIENNVRQMTVVASGHTSHPSPAISSTSFVDSVEKIANQNIEVASLYKEEEDYYDACDSQPWSPRPIEPHAPLLSSSVLHTLGQSIKQAIGYQLQQLSRTEAANNLLHTIHPELSKLLAAALFCGQRGADIVYQAGITGSLTLLSALVYKAVGATTLAVTLTSLPPLLLTWLEANNVSLTQRVIATLNTLAFTGLKICACENLQQPELLVSLHLQVITPIKQLLTCSDLVETVTMGMTLMLGGYTALRLSGLLLENSVKPNTLTHGIKIIQSICSLSEVSEHYAQNKQVWLKNWFLRHHSSPFSESRAEKALERAVNHAITPRLRATLSAESHYLHYQNIEKKMLLGELTPWLGKRNMPAVSHSTSETPMNSMSELAASSPLLIGSAALAATSVSKDWRGVKVSLFGGAALLTTLTYLAKVGWQPSTEDELATSRLPRQAEKSVAVNMPTNICLRALNTTKNFLGSDKTGAPLAIQLFNTLFDDKGDLQFAQAERFLYVGNITEFTSVDSHKMNQHLLDTLSILLGPGISQQVWSINRLIYRVGIEAKEIWLNNSEGLTGTTIKKTLQTLRISVARYYIELGIADTSKLIKITNFILSQIVPEALLLERNGKEDELLHSKNLYYCMNFVENKLAKDSPIQNKDFSQALIEGRIDEFIISRFNCYPHLSPVSDKEASLEAIHKKINKDFYEYHEYDLKLESLPAITLDDVIQSEYSNIDVFLPQNFDTHALIVNNQGTYDRNIRILRKCKSFRDVIRSFEDGLTVVFNLLPEKIPITLRHYLHTDNAIQKSFTLKPHSKLTTLNLMYDNANKQMIASACELYNDVISRAIALLTEEELTFFNNPHSLFYSVGVEVKRFKLLRYMLMPKGLKIHPPVLKKITYNTRPYQQMGKVFFVYNNHTDERRYYAINIEASRNHQRQLPIFRLPINQTKDIIRLSYKTLDENYIFHDDQTFFEPCKEAQQPTTTLYSSWDKTWDYFSERYQFYKNRLCKDFKNPIDIIVKFEENLLTENNISSVIALKKELIRDRKELLTYIQKRNHVAHFTDAERSNVKGSLKQLIETLPFYSCYELYRDIFSTQEDITPPSMGLPLFQAAICAADFYLGYNIRNSMTTLIQSYRQHHLKSWLKKSELVLFRKNLNAAYTQPHSSHMRYPPEFTEQLIAQEKQLELLTTQISDLRGKIKSSAASLLSTPIFVAFPYLTLRPENNMLSFFRPWGFNMAKMSVKKLYLHNKIENTSSPYATRSGTTIKPKQKNSLSGFDNVTCNVENNKAYNVIHNIFDVKNQDPVLYRKLFFKALQRASPTAIISKAEKEGWLVAENYDRLSMFCFISLTVPIRSYTHQILSQGEFYFTENGITPENNGKPLSEAVLLKYYKNRIANPRAMLKDTLLTAEQNALIDQSISLIKFALRDNIQAVESTYIFMVHHILMTKSSSLLHYSQYSHRDHDGQHIARIEKFLSYELDKLTIFGLHRSLLQQQFHIAVIKKVSFYIKQITENKPAYITLFSPTIEIFNEGIRNHSLYGAERMPTHASYTQNYLQVTDMIATVYASFARIEYTAKALATFPCEEWSLPPAQNAWMAALQPRLFADMHYQNLQAFLLNVTQKLSNAWQKRRIILPEKIVMDDVVNAQFIEDVTAAMIESCHLHQELLFCHVYQQDNGYWFTFLNNDFMYSASQRVKRQTPPSRLLYPLACIEEDTLNFSEIKPLLQYFAASSSAPLHERLYAAWFDLATVPQQTPLLDVAILINNLIDENGSIIDYQLIALQHLVPEKIKIDKSMLLQLLCHALQQAHPASLPLFDFIFNHLQTSFSLDSPRLSELFNVNFVKGQIKDIVTLYSFKMKDKSEKNHQALSRLTAAVVNHLLSFAPLLAAVEPLLGEAPLLSLSSQWLCLGAIIAQRLGITAAYPEVLLQLSRNALQDAGIIPANSLAIQQIALLNPSHTIDTTHHYSASALQTLAASVQNVAEMQIPLLACVRVNQRLVNSLSQLLFTPRGEPQWQQLKDLLKNNLQAQRQLLTTAFSILPPVQLNDFILAASQKGIEVTWYQEASGNGQRGKTAAIAFRLPESGKSLLLPLGNPQFVPLIFRQMPTHTDNLTLSRLCFGMADVERHFLQPLTLTLYLSAHATQINNGSLSMPLFDLLQTEVDDKLSTLTRSINEADFAEQKRQFEDWLAQRFFFFALSDDAQYLQISRQSQHLASLSEHPDVVQWQQRPAAQSAVAFNQAVSRVMGNETQWPEIATLLRETLPAAGGVSLLDLPVTGFIGFWWDPLTHFGYLGWQVADRRVLFASMADNREKFYPLPDSPAYESIWQALDNFNGLEQELQILQQGKISLNDFFDRSIALAWQLHCVKMDALLLPARAVKHPSLPGVFTEASAPTTHVYFCPGTQNKTLPMTLHSTPEGECRLDFQPHDRHVSSDQHFSLKIRLPAAAVEMSQWKWLARNAWRLISGTQAKRFIAAGNFSVSSYLQQIRPRDVSNKMVPSPRVLQRNDGSVVFIFAEDNFKRVGYRVMDAQGILQISPTVPADWPQDVIASGTLSPAQGFDITVVNFIVRQQALAQPQFFPLLLHNSLDNLSLETSQTPLRHWQARLNNNTQTMIGSDSLLPYRFELSDSAEFELAHLRQHFRGMGQEFYAVVEAQTQNVLQVEASLWNIFNWREANLYHPEESSAAASVLKLKQLVFEQMVIIIEKDHHQGEQYQNLLNWIVLAKGYIRRSISVLQSLTAIPPSRHSALPPLLPRRLLEQHRQAENYFFSHYGEQPHSTTDDFNSAWQYLDDEEHTEALQVDWQQALDTLKLLASGVPEDNELINRLLTLPENTRHNHGVCQHLVVWQSALENSLAYWKNAHFSESLHLLRPAVSMQDLPLMSINNAWPVQLILSAGLKDFSAGSSDMAEKRFAAAQPLSIEQNDDLLQVNAGPERGTHSQTHPAGVAGSPKTALEFSTRVKHRLSSPYALAELTDSAFLLRLQTRIRTVMINEVDTWQEQERVFYQSTDVEKFMQQREFELVDKKQHAAFFRHLFASEQLMIRLIMHDPEMLFGLLCDVHIDQLNALSQQDILKAWFLYLHIFDHPLAAQSNVQLYLVGV